jgi:hypothetical protein
VLTHGNFYEAKLYLNTETEWKAYRFRSASREGGRVEIWLNAADLKPGLNSFFIKGGPRFDIVGLRLDVPDAPRAKPVVARKTATAESPQRKQRDDSATAPADTAPAATTSQQTQFAASGDPGTGSPELTLDLEKEPPLQDQKKADHPSDRKATPDAVVQSKVSGIRWAVVIGVSNYQDTRIPCLRYASEDARSFHDWLVSPDGGKYSPSRVKLLIDADATENGIRNALFEWLGQALEEDVVTIFFAGHGSPQSPDKPDNLFLLPYDTQYDSVATTGFPMWDIETALRRFILAKKVVVIADACHAGGVGQAFDVARRASRGIKAVPISSNLQHLTKIGDGICIISASDDSQYSQESKKWGGGHGVFTYYLLRGLKGEADYSKDSRVTLGEIVPYLSEQVRRATANAQSPTVAGRFDPALTIGK